MVTGDSSELHHYSDPFAETMVTSRKSREDSEWFEFFLHEMLGVAER